MFFSLFVSRNDAEAMKMFSGHNHKLAPLYQSSKRLLSEDVLNQVSQSTTELLGLTSKALVVHV